MCVLTINEADASCISQFGPLFVKSLVVFECIQRCVCVLACCGAGRCFGVCCVLDVFVCAVVLLGVTVHFSALRLHNFRVGIKRPNQVLKA